ncbi:MAG: hypothetical protein NT006_09620 [Candidatus Aminicenantes bacterium]|nr:hypothetical protein [Candidatus Aminicenantes bacterium]
MAVRLWDRVKKILLGGGKNVQDPRIFPNYFKNFVFISVGVVDWKNKKEGTRATQCQFWHCVDLVPS